MMYIARLKIFDKNMFRSKRGLDFGLGRGYSGSQARTFHRAKLEIEYYHPSFRQPDIS